MASRFILAGVGDIQLFDQGTGEIIVTSKTLTDSGINFSVTAEDIRGGKANAILGKYFHDTAMELTLTDALFSLEYLALNVGGTITASSNVFTTEQITTSVADTITVTDTPQTFGSVGTIGWYSIAGKDEWTKITFEGKDATVSNLPQGTTVCVKYIHTDASAEQFVVSSAFIPDQVHAVLTLPLFKATVGSDASYTSSSKVGEVQVDIPNFLLAGAQELSLSSSGAATTALSGSALASYTGQEGCDSDGYYAVLKQIVYNKDEWADVKAIVIADSDIDLAPAETQTLEVYALYSGVKAPRLLDNSKLTFTSSDDTYAEVGAHTGIVTAVADGTANIEVVVTDHADLNAMAVVTVETPSP